MKPEVYGIRELGLDELAYVNGGADDPPAVTPPPSPPDVQSPPSVVPYVVPCNDGQNACWAWDSPYDNEYIVQAPNQTVDGQCAIYQGPCTL